MTAFSSDDAIVRLFHVHRHYSNQQALIDVTLDIYRNEFVFVTGPSGAGKTTLLKLLYRGESASQGQILVDGLNIARLPHKRIHLLRRKFGIVFQDYKLIATRSVYENIALVLEAAGKKPSYIRKKVHSILRTVGLDHKTEALPPALSGGEQQRVAVARAVVADPPIILADEPTGSLDADSALLIMEQLKAFHTRGATVVLATHDRELIRSIPARVIQLRQGRLAATAAPPTAGVGPLE
jgi:cell division transport system ATP-binding protein